MILHILYKRGIYGLNSDLNPAFTLTQSACFLATRTRDLYLKHYSK